MQPLARNITACRLQMLLQLADALARGQLTRRECLTMANRRRAAHHFAEQPAGTHHAGAAERDMRGGDKPPGQEEIFERAAVEAAPGNGVGAFAVKLAAAVVGTVNAVRRVQINRPAAVGHGVVVVALFDNILLAEQIIAHKPAAFALTGDGADPLDSQVVGIREQAGVFNMIPDAPDYLPQLPFDLLALMNGVERPPHSSHQRSQPFRVEVRRW